MTARKMRTSLIFELRGWLCELLIQWALCISPEGYTPSLIQVIVDERARHDAQ